MPTTETSKATVKPKTGKLPAAVKAEAKKDTVKKEAAKKETPKKAAADGQIKITQVQGTIARKWDQKATLVGLGLNKRHRTRILQDTPEIRGMVNKVKHLVTVEKA